MMKYMVAWGLGGKMIKCKQAQSMLKDGVNKNGEVAVGGPATPQRLESKLLVVWWACGVEGWYEVEVVKERSNRAEES